MNLDHWYGRTRLERVRPSTPAETIRSKRQEAERLVRQAEGCLRRARKLREAADRMAAELN